jgi:diacylglycerol kinase family enzyme
MDDSKIDLCILRRFYFRDMLRMIGRLILRKLPEDRGVAFYQAKRIEIRSDPPLDLQIDGEIVDQTTPLVAEVLPRALKVRVPKAVEEQTKNL